MNEKDYLDNRLEDQIGGYSQKSQFNKKWHQSLRLIEIAAATSIPFLAGYITDTCTTKIFIGSLGFLVAIITSLLSLFRFQELWVEYRATAESLKHEKYLFITKTEPYTIQEPFPLLVQRVESLISKEHSRWNNLIKKSEKKPPSS